MANIATALISVAATAVFTRLLLPEDYGAVNLFIAGTAICFVITSLGSYLRIAALLPIATESEYREFFSSAVTGSALISFAIAISLALARQFSYRIGGVLIPNEWIWMLPLSGWLQSVTILRQYTLQARGEALRYVGYQVGTPILGVVLSYLCFHFGTHEGWEWRVVGIIVAQGLSTGYALWECWKESHLRQIGLRSLGSYARSTWSLAIFEVIALLASYLGLFVVNHYGGTADAGIYSVALLFGLAVESAASAANRSFSSSLSQALREGPAEVSQWIYKGGQACLGVAGFATVVWGLSPWLLPILADKNYSAAKIYIPWICLRFVLLSLQRSINSIALVKGRAWQLSVSALVALATSLLAAKLLGPIYGGISGVVAMLVGTVLGLLVSLGLLYQSELRPTLQQVNSLP